MKQFTAKLKYVARFGYGDSLPRDRLGNGQFQVYGSNGPYSRFSEANTQSPAIIVGRKGSYGKVNWSDGPCFASDTTFFIDCTTCRHHLRWLYWLLHTLELDEGTDEAAVPGLNREIAYAKNVIVPPLAQQRAIADYLDYETERLDALVAAKERLLDLLAEKRRAIIAHAVTGRLEFATAPAEGDRRPQRSGGGYRASVRGSDRTSRHGITEHDWREVRFRHLADVRKGAIPATGIDADLDSELLPYLTMEYLRGDGSDPKLAPADPSLLVASEDSILLLWDGANAGEFLRARRGIVSSTSAMVVPKGVDHDFFYWACKNQEDRIRSQTVGMGVPHVNGDFLANMIIPLPSPLRQRAIADYLGHETAQLDKLAARTRDTIMLLRERRAALVTAAVTGQIEVEHAS